MILFSGIFVHPFIVYPRRKKIWKMKDMLYKKWYFWYADTYETKFGDYNYLNSTYGLYELLKNEEGFPDYKKFKTLPKWKKFVLAYRWGVIRNGCWNYIIREAPKKGEKFNVNKITDEGEGTIWDWRDKEDFGKKHVTWDDKEFGGKKYFRYSLTRKANWYNLQRLGLFLVTFKWHTHYNFMMGTGGSNNRNLIKSRTFKI